MTYDRSKEFGASQVGRIISLGGILICNRRIPTGGFNRDSAVATTDTYAAAKPYCWFGQERLTLPIPLLTVSILE